MIDWKDISDDEIGEQYRHQVSGSKLAELWHCQYEQYGESVNEWRLILAKLVPVDGVKKLVTETHKFSGEVDAEGAKALAEEHLEAFMGVGT